jgi:hypothetical protein
MELQFSPTACFTWSYFCIGKDHESLYEKIPGKFLSI